MKSLTFPLFALVILILIAAGCTQQATVTPPVQTTAVTPPPHTTLPVTIETSLPVTSPVPMATCTTAPAPVTPLPASGYRFFSDPDYSLEYPASWQTNETTRPLGEFIHTDHGCSVTSYYQINQRLRFFTSPDGNALIYASIVDTNTDVWPRDINGNIVHADIINGILGDPTHCANTPEGAFTISSVTQELVTGVPYEVTRFDFGKINSLGFTDGAGTALLVTGIHKRGVFTFYAANSSAGAWDNGGAHLFNTLKLDPNF